MNQTRPSESRLRVPQRDQVLLAMAAVDGLIEADHPARVIWQVVAGLDLGLFYAAIKAREGQGGRDSTDPRLLVALWLYASTEGVGSARESSRLCVESAPYQWLCGGVSLNHHTLSDFRMGHAAALDALFTAVLASLLKKKLVSVHRTSQDGTRVRACAGAGSFRRKDRLRVLQTQAAQHVASLRRMLDDPQQSAALGAKKKAALERAAVQRQQRIEQAIAQLPVLEAEQQERALTMSKKDKQAGRIKEPRVSTTDPEAWVMRMPDGGYRPALNVQLAVDTASRAIVGVSVVNAGVDTGQLRPMREQVERRGKQKVAEHLADGGYLTIQDVEDAPGQNLTLYLPPKPPRNAQKFGDAHQPRPGDTEAVKQWRARMGTDAARAIYARRASTSETVNADLKTHRGLLPFNVRGIAKATCVTLWCALAYNLMHFGAHLLG